MGLGRTPLLVLVCLLTLVVPGLPALAVAAAPARSLAELVLVAAAAWAWVALAGLVAPWEFVGRRLRWAWAAALAAATAWRFGAHPAPTRLSLGATAWVAVPLLAVAVAALEAALRARRHPGEALALRFPLEGGRFLVTDGGDGARSFLMNYHFGFRGHRGAGVAGAMRFALDVVEVGPLEIEARGLLPRRNGAYRIWGRPVLAPCIGVVVTAVDGVADNDAFGPDRPYGVGNHVVIRCGSDAFVVLGHLRRGSVRVREGERVQAGQPIGAVGNSGWTERPHLHVQASRSAEGDYWHGEPLPMRFGGRFPVKNQLVRPPPAAPGT
jgi:hypothetical protein